MSLRLAAPSEPQSLAAGGDGAASRGRVRRADGTPTLVPGIELLDDALRSLVTARATLDLSCNVGVNVPHVVAESIRDEVSDAYAVVAAFKETWERAWRDAKGGAS